jgi:hypothetical protein
MRHAAALVLVAPAVADAKEIKKARVCGVDACVTTQDHGVLQGMMNGGPPTVPPSTDGAAFRVTGAIVEPGHGVVAHVHSWWVPSLLTLVGEDGTWMPLDPASAKAFERVTRGLTAIPGAKTGLAVSAPAEPKAPPAPADDGGMPVWVPIGVVAAIAAAGAAALLRRRPRGDAPSSGEQRPAAAPPA